MRHATAHQPSDDDDNSPRRKGASQKRHDVKVLDKGIKVGSIDQERRKLRTQKVHTKRKNQVD